MSLSYPEPSSSFQTISNFTPSADGGVVLTSNGVDLEIGHLSGIGWSLEARYDRSHTGVARQPFTGAQTTLTPTKCTTEHDPNSKLLLVHGGADTLTIHLETGSMSASRAGKTYWKSECSPFSAHKEPVKILEDIQSIEQTHWDEPTPYRLVPTQFETRMVRFRYPAPRGAILGLPGQCGEFNRRGYRYDLFNNDQPWHIPSRPQMYQAWPIVMHEGTNGEGWVGVFHDNPARTFVDLGDFYRDTVLFESITNNTRVYIVADENLSGVTQRFVKLLGTPVFPPSWAFGYQQCRYSYMSSDEIRVVTERLRSDKIPCDSIYFDIDYMDGYRVFTRNPETFGDLTECLQDVKENGFEPVCIIDPGVKIDPKNETYAALLKRDAYLKDSENNTFEILCWPGKAALPDFFSERVRAQWSSIQKQWLKTYPFSGVWNDMNEPSNFDGGREKTATAQSELGPIRNFYNLYGYSMAAASAQGWTEAHPEKRGVIITRSGYPGVQRHAVVWHGDNSAWWEHLRLAIDTAVSYALCGCFYTGPDIPGFFNNPSDDMATRAFQLGAFLPLFRGHAYKLTSSKEPYAYPGEAGRRIRDAVDLRYSLVREWYSSYESSRRTGTPLLEPLLDAEKNPVRDCFILFGKLLVAGVTTRDERARAIWLPDGVWYRLGETEKMIQGGQWILEPVTLDQLPVFVRGGTILTRNTPQRNTPETLAAQERFEIYRDASGAAAGYWYGDDGVSTTDSRAQRIALSVTRGSEVVEKQSI